MASIQSAAALPMRGLCPAGPAVTDYDRRNYRLYTHLLILEEDGATFEELAQLLGFEEGSNREWVRRVLVSHLQRARWLQDQICPTIE